MSGTAHQRQVADLKAAGLNPLLSASSGASTPQGAMATVQNVEQQGIASAMNALAGTADIGIKLGQIQLMKTQSELASAGVGLSKAQTQKAKVEAKARTKDIPKADMMNKFYRNILEPIMDNLQQINMKNWKKGVKKLKPEDMLIEGNASPKGGLR